MILTREWIHEHATKGQGWTRHQLAVLGVGFPPPRGWLKKLVGTEISDEIAEEFARLVKGRHEKPILRIFEPHIRAPLQWEPRGKKSKKKNKITRAIPKKPHPDAYEASEAFLLSYEWRRCRMGVLVKHGARCQCCGATPKDGIRIHVDHIKPRRLYPELALDPNNLQILCEVCNHGKGNWDETDWRDEGEADAQERQRLKLIIAKDKTWAV